MKSFHNHCRLLILLLLGTAGAVQAEEVYLEPQTYVARHLPQAEESQNLWISGELRSLSEEILGHRPLALRQRYWLAGDRSVWILEEIGKEKPITAGFVVENDRIVDTTVLIFRESRGWEIRYPDFTAQFAHASLDSRRQLDRSIDGISGATLSVNAMRKLARLALTYHRHVMQQRPAIAGRITAQPVNQ